MVQSVLGVLRPGRVTTEEDRLLLRCPANLHLEDSRPLGVTGVGTRMTWFPASASIASMRPPATATSTQKLSTLFEMRGASGESISNETICEVLADQADVDEADGDVKVTLCKTATNQVHKRFMCDGSMFLDYDRLDNKIRRLFELQDRQILIYYRDVEGDRILLATNDDLAYLKTNGLKDGSTKLEIIVKNPVSSVLKYLK